MSVSEQVREIARKIWEREWYPHREINWSCERFKDLPREEGWLRRVRIALYIPLREAARKLNIKTASYARFEKGEIDGSITLANLRRNRRSSIKVWIGQFAGCHKNRRPAWGPAFEASTLRLRTTC